MTSGPFPHVLILPKWWPNAVDPQLGDFIRKQVQAIQSVTKVSVLLVEPGQERTVVVVQEDGLPIVRSTYIAHSGRSGAVRRTVNFLRYWRATRRGYLALVAAYGSPQVVHVHIMVRPALLAFWLRMRNGIPYLISEQSSEYLDGTFARKSGYFKALNRYLFKRAAEITVVSRWLGEGLEKLGLTSRYSIVPNVVPGLDRPLPPPGPPGQYLVVADLVDKTKNVSGVIRAFAHAREQVSDLGLTVIGDGPDREFLHDLVRTLDLQTHVRFLGRLPNAEVLDHMAHTGAVIINSNVETFSVVTGEALAQGKPVIATRCGGPEAFVTARNGILVDVGDERALCTAMVQMSAGMDNYGPEEMRSSVQERSSPGQVGSAFLRIYQETLARTHGGT
ncbi:MAG: glycosyltransferase [Flavobacteriales bacterium]|nr:glycosyltransferase [Flavobacteriales bacterium]MBK6549119.1 glycosyltransferase [Flavobacteriales bacterium]MBK6884292.1 glycosyltransferase [Flavobacteriales bacterium]MBK7100681.1 glycosyltransferase [Flavobacteriales bacterium]MBK7111378.1 glycosyltransferase [Flavobacteriales bacterium]